MNMIEDRITFLRARIDRDIIPVTESGCWLWLGEIIWNGYGKFRVKGKYILAHRASWEAYRGEIPAGLFVCHTCDIRCCVNPDHLFLGTRQDNADDMVRKGRHTPCHGERAGHAKLTNANVLEIRSSSLSSTKLARIYGVSKGAVLMARARRTWKHI